MDWMSMSKSKSKSNYTLQKQYKIQIGFFDI